MGAKTTPKAPVAKHPDYLRLVERPVTDREKCATDTAKLLLILQRIAARIDSERLERQTKGNLELASVPEGRGFASEAPLEHIA